MMKFSLAMHLWIDLNFWLDFEYCENEKKKIQNPKWNSYLKLHIEFYMVEISFNQAKKNLPVNLNSLLLLCGFVCQTNSGLRKMQTIDKSKNICISWLLFLYPRSPSVLFKNHIAHILHYSEDRPKFIAAMVDILVVAS